MFLTSRKRRAEDADGKFHPNEEEDQERKGDPQDPVCGFFNLYQDQGDARAGHEEQDARDQKIKTAPHHFSAGKHHQQRNEQQCGRGQGKEHPFFCFGFHGISLSCGSELLYCY